MGISVCNEPKRNNVKLDKESQKQLKKDLSHLKKNLRRNRSYSSTKPLKTFKYSINFSLNPSFLKCSLGEGVSIGIKP